MKIDELVKKIFGMKGFKIGDEVINKYHGSLWGKIIGFRKNPISGNNEIIVKRDAVYHGDDEEPTYWSLDAMVRKDKLSGGDTHVEKKHKLPDEEKS